VHQLALRLVVELAGPTQSQLAAVGVVATAFLLTLLGSVLLYRFVEIPGLRLLRPRRAATSPSLQPAALG
jgi:peptidoglycan/LPS O-acetylase OafA/YrhL